MQRVIQKSQEIGQAATNIASGAGAVSLPFVVTAKPIVELAIMIAGFILVCMQIYYLRKKNKK